MTENNLLSQIERNITILDLYIKEIKKTKILSPPWNPPYDDHCFHPHFTHVTKRVRVKIFLKPNYNLYKKQPKTQVQMPHDLFTPYPIYYPPYMVQTQPLSFSQDPSYLGYSSFLPTSVVEEKYITKKKETIICFHGKETVSYFPIKKASKRLCTWIFKVPRTTREERYPGQGETFQ